MLDFVVMWAFLHSFLIWKAPHPHCDVGTVLLRHNNDKTNNQTTIREWSTTGKRWKTTVKYDESTTANADVGMVSALLSMKIVQEF
jgi:hypothetical protein